MGRNITCIGLSIGVVLALTARSEAQNIVRNQLNMHTSPVTGLASFVSSADKGPIPIAVPVRAGGAAADAFLDQYGHLFGLSDAARELVEEKVVVDPIGYRHTSYRQVFQGIRVFGGVLRVHQDPRGAVTSANGDFFPIRPGFDVQPVLSVDQATARAASRLPVGNPTVEQAELVIVDPGWYGDPVVGAHLAYYIILTDLSAGVREAFFVNARTGKTLDRWNLLHTIKDRVVIDGITSIIVRTEGGAPTGDFEIDAAYDFAGDTYDYLLRAYGRDSIDGLGATLFATAHLQSTSCPNAFGSTSGTSFCDGVLTDDIVAHEFGHGLTGFTADLIYQNQAGQLNESYSDVIGETVDLLNGDASFAGAPGGTPWPPSATGSGTDTPNTARAGCEFSTLMTINDPVGIAGDYGVQAASFGPGLTEIGVTGDVVVADPVRGCDSDLPFSNAGMMAGKVVLIDRGACLFTEKVRNAQDEGAIGVIIANNVSSGLSPMGGSDPSVTIPSVGTSQTDGGAIKSATVSGTVNVTLHGASGLSVRWMVGEDATGFGGAIRDMWQPSCMGDPDTANHDFQTCNPGDNGGVHSGSGVPNHAFAMLTDGKTFNGHTVNAIGLFKAAAVWQKALTDFLTPFSDFEDAFVAFNQAATDLVGTMILDPRDGSGFAVFTSADANEVNEALLAVEMNTPGRCGTSELLDTSAPTLCGSRTVVYSDDFESGLAGWTVSNTSPPTPYDWIQVGGLPFGRSGTAWFGEDRNVGDCGAADESAVHSLTSPVIALPGNVSSLTLAFTHYFATEAFFDGGHLRIRINGGSWASVPDSAFTFNPYNSNLALSGNTNPFAGQGAFTGEPLAGAGWGTSLVDLSGMVSPGDDIELRFDLSKDGCSGIDGWYVDDVELFTCPVLGCGACQLHGDVFPFVLGAPDANPVGNCVVDVDDILTILSAFSVINQCDPDFPDSVNTFPCGQACSAGTVDVDDILSALAAFSETFDCPHPCPGGACCLADSSCQDADNLPPGTTPDGGMSQTTCEIIGGVYQGDGTTCLDVTCP